MEVVTIGESMLRFSPSYGERLGSAQNFHIGIAGAESNFAIGLARLGHRVGWISRLSEDSFGRKIAHFIRGEGVDISQVQWESEHSAGLMFRSLQTPISVQYYRDNSASSHLKPEDLNEEYIAQAQYLFLTGITPALSQSCLETVQKAIEIAQKHRLTLVFDPNFRQKLWRNTETARKVLNDLARASHILLLGKDEANILGKDWLSETTIEK